MKPHSPALLLQLCHFSAYGCGRHGCWCSGARARSVSSLRMAFPAGTRLSLLCSYACFGVRPRQRSSRYVTVGELRSPSVDAGLEHVRFPIRAKMQDKKLCPAVNGPAGRQDRTNLSPSAQTARCILGTSFGSGLPGHRKVTAVWGKARRLGGLLQLCKGLARIRQAMRFHRACMEPQLPASLDVKPSAYAG